MDLGKELAKQSMDDAAVLENQKEFERIQLENRDESDLPKEILKEGKI